jgi:hypothetical protein
MNACIRFSSPSANTSGESLCYPKIQNGYGSVASGHTGSQLVNWMAAPLHGGWPDRRFGVNRSPGRSAYGHAASVVLGAAVHTGPLASWKPSFRRIVSFGGKRKIYGSPLGSGSQRGQHRQGGGRMLITVDAASGKRSPSPPSEKGRRKFLASPAGTGGVGDGARGAFPIIWQQPDYGHGHSLST